MKRFVTVCVALCGLVLASCAEQRPTTAEAMVLAMSTGTTVVKTTEQLARQGKLNRKQVCTVQQYAKLFGDTMDAAFVAMIDGNPQQAEEYVDAAVKIINGVDASARQLAADACADGNPEG